ncbi:MAG: hypothetical protein WBM40_04315 [Thiohalocapsa sp.]
MQSASRNTVKPYMARTLSPLPLPIRTPQRPISYDANHGTDGAYVDALWLAATDLSFWWRGEAPIGDRVEILDWLHKKLVRAQQAGDPRPPADVVEDIRFDRIG